MRDFLLYVAGWLSVTTALVHSWLDETDVFARVRIEPERLRSLVQLVWHCSAVGWGWHCYSTERCAKDGVAGPGSSMRCSIKGAFGRLDVLLAHDKRPSALSWETPRSS
jgi:hypothetical protein